MADATGETGPHVPSRESGMDVTSDTAFKDHFFSAVADAYAAARLEYPHVLFRALAAVVPRTATVWALPHFLRDLGSLSATARCLARSGDDAVARHAAPLAAAWGAPDTVRVLRLRLFLHLRRKP